MQQKPTARIISASDKGLETCAASARISTQEGTSIELFNARKGDEKDIRLVGKVLSSGHKSVIEHHVFTIAFENVSVYAEQFLIEFRLASFTVKSRRYVNFENAGFYLPGDAPAAFAPAMRACFEAYARLTALGIPREDARFVLPYCFFSNFYMTVNARELIHVIRAMRNGRASRYPELMELGNQLFEQLERFYPGVIELECARAAQEAPVQAFSGLGRPQQAHGTARLISAPANAQALLDEALAFSGNPRDLSALVQSNRPRALETLSYTFVLEDVSLACVTHFARHRMQSPIFEPTQAALTRYRYVMPASIEANPEALALYQSTLQTHRDAVEAMRADGLSYSHLPYCALSGMTVRVMLTMNARSLLHFMKLRTCERAQWEIRDLATQMLDQLQAQFPALFSLYGPSCAVDGHCPEGRLSCGKPKRRNSDAR